MALPLSCHTPWSCRAVVRIGFVSNRPGGSLDSEVDDNGNTATHQERLSYPLPVRGVGHGFFALYPRDIMRFGDEEQEFDYCGAEEAEGEAAGKAPSFPWAGVDLTVLEGISETTALVVLSEIGTDLSKFPHEKNFVSWLGLCPQHRGSAGKTFKRRTRRGANR